LERSIEKRFREEGIKGGFVVKKSRASVEDGWWREEERGRKREEKIVGWY
jgi:hypothetical protein